jgi:hypothetical protein
LLSSVLLSPSLLLSATDELYALFIIAMSFFGVKQSDSTMELLPIDDAGEPYLLQPSLRLPTSVLLSPLLVVSAPGEVFALRFMLAMLLVGVDLTEGREERIED